MRLRLVHGSRGNVFLREILEAVAFEAQQRGVDAAVVDDEPGPDTPDTAYVVMPHEYFVVVPPRRWLDRARLGRTIALNVEHPGTPWFELAAQQAVRCARVFDINDDSALELARRGLRVDRLRLGGTRAWTRWDGREGARPHDVVYLGGTDARRDAYLAGYARHWWDLDTRLHLTPNTPRGPDSPGFLTGAAKYGLLARSKVLVNLHRDGSRALEWVRVIEAMANGCVVVSEHSIDAAPLVPGVHYVSAHPARLGRLAKELAADPQRLTTMRTAAADLLTAMPLADSVARLLEAAEGLVAQPAPVPDPVDVPTPPPAGGDPPPPWPTGERDRLEAVGAAIARVEARLVKAERREALARLGVASVREAQQPVARTPAYDAARPRVSVLVPLFRHGRLLPEALDSIRASTGVAFEILVQDDGSDDDSLDVARNYLAEHPDTPMHLTAGRVNHGVTVTRNLLLERARGEYVLPVDADNGVYPTALAEFVAALDAEPEAPFAYAPIVCLRDGEPAGFVSAFAWDPQALRYGTGIDTMAMLRTADLRAQGGWAEDLVVWEDHELWLRFAEAGRTPVFLPKALTWYRLTDHSLRMASGHDDRTMWSRLRASAPSLFRGMA